MTLEEICTHIVDCAHKTAPTTESGDYFAVGTPAMRGHVINYNEARPIDRDTFDAWTTRLRPKHGDLLLAREAPVGPVVRIPREENVAPGQRTVLLRPDPSVVDPQFLYYYLISPARQAALLVKASGSTVPHLNVADVRTFPTPGIPSLAEQRAIAKALGALDDKIAANDKLIDTVDEYLGCEFTRLSAGTKSGNLRDIATVSTSVARPVIGGCLRYLDISAVSVGSYSLPVVTKWEDAPGRARRAVKAGDTVWSTVRPNRRSHALILDDDPLLVGSTGLAVLSPKKGRIACTYESTRRDGFVQYLEGVAEGSAYPAVRADRFNEAPVPALRDEQWDHFESIALPLRRRTHAATVENRSLTAARDELLPLLMSGKVHVRDAEKVVEGVV